MTSSNCSLSPIDFNYKGIREIGGLGVYALADEPAQISDDRDASLVFHPRWTNDSNITQSAVERRVSRCYDRKFSHRGNAKFRTDRDLHPFAAVADTFIEDLNKPALF